MSVFDFINNTYKTAKAGTLAPLNEIFTGELALDEKEYSKNIMNACTYDGNQYFYPVALSIPCLLTTKSMMDEQKFDLAKCKTILDFLAESKKYVDQTEPRLLDRSDSLLNIVQFANLSIADYKNEKINLEDKKLHELLEGYKAIYPQEMLDQKNQVESSIGWPVRKSAMAERLENQRYMAGSTIENVPLVDLTDEMVALIQGVYDSIETASFSDPFDSMLIDELNDYLSKSDKGLEESLENARDALEILVSE